MKLKTMIFVLAMLLGICQGSAWAWPIKKQEIDYENQNFQKWWAIYLTWHFDSLPKRGMVPKYRMPYAGHIYPDSRGGTANVLAKYDEAFHNNVGNSYYHEYKDIRMRGAPYWAGHCNGWTAAAIRHAEPEKSVVRNGVTFTPSDIKGLLAELYVHCETEFLGGMDEEINPGMFHVMVTNWVGKGEHPIGMDKSVGYEVWNFPIYAYAYDFKKKSDQLVEVRMNVGYVNLLESEQDKAPKNNVLFMSLHYDLNLTEDGEIIGGEYYSDSERADMLWTPLQPTQGGTEGNKEGNPHLDMKEVLSMWRESASEELQKKWWNVDPIEEDAIFEEDDSEQADDSSLTNESAAETSEQDATETIVEPNEAIESNAEEQASEQSEIAEVRPTNETESTETEEGVSEETEPAEEADARNTLMLRKRLLRTRR